MTAQKENAKSRNPHYADTHAKPTNPGNEPLSGSKKVKQANHSRQNNGEGTTA